MKDILDKIQKSTDPKTYAEAFLEGYKMGVKLERNSICEDKFIINNLDKIVDDGIKEQYEYFLGDESGYSS